MIRLGQKVHDGITGFEGIATARTEWLNGCIRFAVQSAELHDGVPTEAQWFDETQLSVVSVDVEQPVRGDPKPVGGPQKDPKPLLGG